MNCIVNNSLQLTRRAWQKVCLVLPAGLATLWMAVFADMGTLLLATFNGMRLLREQ